jgi:hypothetical protein
MQLRLVLPLSVSLLCAAVSLSATNAEGVPAPSPDKAGEAQARDRPLSR